MKRTFSLITLALLPAIFTAAQTVSPPPSTLGKPKLIKGSLYVIEAALNGAEGPNIAIYVTSEGGVVVDDWFDQAYEQVVARVKAVTDQPIKYVVKTHSH